ncbi:hypothetical protein HHI36_007059 [Cryptolaemus montrouzieri]|uniref:Uncharacterized protein n=1 Tax=Cryptolaemus montrouzieri TaxID=559131 RepID=A0ABD2MNH1_9CUCU
MEGLYVEDVQELSCPVERVVDDLGDHQQDLVVVPSTQMIVAMSVGTVGIMQETVQDTKEEVVAVDVGLVHDQEAEAVTEDLAREALGPGAVPEIVPVRVQLRLKEAAAGLVLMINTPDRDLALAAALLPSKTAIIIKIREYLDVTSNWCGS